jgi:hypothetical protein
MVEKGAKYPNAAFIGLKSSIFFATFEVLIKIHQAETVILDNT